MRCNDKKKTQILNKIAHLARQPSLAYNEYSLARVDAQSEQFSLYLNSNYFMKNIKINFEFLLTLVLFRDIIIGNKIHKEMGNLS
jgi:hypothetical protein